MKKSDFASSAPGMLISNIAGSLTFVPNPLPPKFDLDSETIDLALNAIPDKVVCNGVESLA